MYRKESFALPQGGPRPPIGIRLEPLDTVKISDRRVRQNLNAAP